MNITYLPILSYKQILPEDHPLFKSSESVSPDNLKRQITTLLSWGWEFQTLEKYFSSPNSKGSPKIMVITFDEVGAHFIEYALPVLKSLNVKASLFLVQHTTSLSKDEIVMMNKDGYEFGSLGQSGRNLHETSLEEAVKEMYDSKEWLEDVLAKPISSISYPGKGIDLDLAEGARNLGYSYGVSPFEGSIQVLSTDIMALRRICIKNDTLNAKLLFITGRLYGLCRFIIRALRKSEQLKERHPSILGININEKE